MKKMFLVLLIIFTTALLAACGESSQSAINSDKNPVAEEPSSQNNAEKRIIFNRDNKEDISYKQHITDLWEKTKPLLKEDIAKDYSDDQYKKLGAEINEAWVNLQIHSSLNHQDELDSITDVEYANLSGNIIGLIDELYGNRDSGTMEKREERREKLKKGRLEYKIEKFDATFQKVD